jgi:outer membrane immunogenic protein
VFALAAGYSVIHVVRGFSLTANGGSGSAALNITRWFGIAGDLGIYHASPGAGLTALTYTAGPRFSYRRWNRFTPFGQVLIGGAHVVSASQANYNGPSNALALGLGGGADFGFGSSGHWAVRPQLEYFGFGTPSDFGFGDATGTIRVSLGLVYRIAKK